MWQDLAALTPPLVVCIAFLVGVAMLLRREMSPKRRAERNARRGSRDDRPRNLPDDGLSRTCRTARTGRTAWPRDHSNGAVHDLSRAGDANGPTYL